MKRASRRSRWTGEVARMTYDTIAVETQGRVGLIVSTGPKRSTR